MVEEVRKRQLNLGMDAVRFAWVKAHVGTHGNKKADQMAKSGAELRDEDGESPLPHWEGQPPGLATCPGRRHTRPMPTMREVCRDREAHSPGLHTRRGYREAMGDVGAYG